MSDLATILWVDDEIDLLKPQILFLQNKGYRILTETNGVDAIEKCRNEVLDIVFLDEQMPGLSGLETLSRIKAIQPQLPIVMITKNEEENLMEDAIGAQISDYLIKPVKPNQILLTLKKNLDNKRLISEKTSSSYQQGFQELYGQIISGLNYDEWIDVYKKLVFWEIELDKSDNEGMKEVLAMQKSEANSEFCKFISKNYTGWLKNPDHSPVMSHNLIRKKVFPYLNDKPTFFLLLDNLRYDQWRVIAPIISETFRVTEEDAFYSLLPTSTQYSRNAIFAGMYPIEIEKRFPNYWLNDEEEGGKNLHEEDFMRDQLSRLKKDTKFSYSKVVNLADGKNLVENILNMLKNPFNVVVYNFVDLFSHARTDTQVLRELTSDETSYRSVTQAWFRHSPLYHALQKLADHKVNLIITTDHGSIRVKEPSKVIGDRDTTTNLRYKHGKNLNFEPKDVLAFRNPNDAMLPKPHVSSTFIFAKEDKFFVYPNNYNYHVNYYRNTFQHGGISLEEMICPFIRLENK